MSELLKLDEQIAFSLRGLYQKYGYSQFKMSKFEPYDLYMLNKEFLVSDGIIAFTDTDGTLMALKPDVTLSIVKNYRSDQMPIQKVCYDENVYRIGGTGKHFREIMQVGLECLGDIGLYELCETIMLAAKSLAVISDRYMLDISHMDLLASAMSKLNIDDNSVSQIMKCFADKNEDGLLDCVPPEQAAMLASLMQINGPIVQATEQLKALLPNVDYSALDAISTYLTQTGIADRVNLDFSIISNRNYYNGIVFRGYVDGIPSAILAGGQYDKLMRKMGKQAKGIGFAVYLDQLELLDNRSKAFDVDTILLCSADEIPAHVAKAMEELSDNSILVLREKPKRTRYRRLITLKDGRLEELENNG